ncbi:hypothetical protein [Sphingopyxis sp.]|uniref:hypothetical protein n=1 Tax=Sphingopyxis sp. TaxID=1908224 RepID=UPI002D7863AD|nr:hypothetical protein [Sphingopyxis sp.]HET6526829.1 hypothetical protein [Sphingopyxis sp.]
MPGPPQPQITTYEQREIIRAALETLHPHIFITRPNPLRALTLADHIEKILLEAIGCTAQNNLSAVPWLLADMAAAAAGKLEEVVRRRLEMPDPRP